MSWADRILDLLFPPKCVFCGKLLSKGETGLCAACQKELPWLTGPQAERKAEFLSLCVSPLRYQGVVRKSFHRYKFQGVRSYAGTYGLLMAQCVRDHDMGPFDCVTWVPLSAKRRRKRGYDQAMLLAQVLAEELGLEARPTLTKCRDNPAQSGLPGAGAAQRRANVLGAYEVIDSAALAGQRLLLVDDIITSGATLSECTRVLLTAGAESVRACTLAQAGR